MKKCPICNIEKELTEYHKNSGTKDKLQYCCKTCNRTRVLGYWKKYPVENDKAKIRAKKRTYRIRNRVNQYKKDIGCYICKEKDYICLDFHHISDKVYGISKLCSAKSLQNLILEIRKCIVLCSNCHRKLHHNHISLPIEIELCQISDDYFDFIKTQRPKIKKEVIKEKKIKTSKVKKRRIRKYNYIKKTDKEYSYKIEWPDNQELERLVWSMPHRKLSKILGVSDRAIQKRCKKLGIKCPEKGYWIRKNDSVANIGIASRS